MPDSKTTVLAAISAFATNDVLMVVDVSDTSMAASGTSKAMTLSQLSAVIDAAIGSTRGAVLVRGASGWVVLAPGAAGTHLRSAGAGADPAWSSVGLKIDTHYGAIGSAPDAATITFDMSTNEWWTVTGGLGGNRTLAVSNVAVGQQFTISLLQDGTGSRTVTWFSGITWIGTGGSPPTLTTTPGKKDVFTFKCTGSGAYDGFVAGQNG